MIVVKLGGSLNRDPLLRDWLQLLGTSGRGRVVIVPGGGGFADLVREHQSHWGFDDLAAHNMAVLAMMQSATMFCSLGARLETGLETGLGAGLGPDLAPVTTRADIARVLQAGAAAVWFPADWIRSAPDDMTQWGATSDSLAAWLATSIGASRLVLVKAADVDPAADLACHARSGMVDADFCRLTREARYSIAVLGKAELGRMRGLLCDSAESGSGAR